MNKENWVKMFKEKNTDIKNILEKQLALINDDIIKLKEQQKRILYIMNLNNSNLYSKPLTKELWIEILQNSGLDEKGMENWHKQFEKTAPEGHQNFLESLGLSKDEIETIRSNSRKDKK